MKKKLIKQLKKCSKYYSGDKSCKFWDLINSLPEEQQEKAYTLGVILQNSESDILHKIGLVFDEVEEKQREPKWIKVNTEGLNHPFEKNKIFEVDRYDSKTYFVISDNSIKSILKIYTSIPTPAEIEAHKLGFHVGDKVYVIGFESDKGDIIKEFFIKDNRWLKCKYVNGLENLISDIKANGGEKVCIITKTPPKTPVFHIKGKDMFEGDESFRILKQQNWKLEKEIINKGHTDQSNDNLWGRRFATKQDALNYVLEEANRRFDGAKQIRYKNGDNIYINSKNLQIKNTLDLGEGISDGLYFIWNEKEGWMGLPIKEPELMLGEYEVNIIPNKIPSEGLLTNYTYEKHSYDVSRTWIEAKRDGHIIGQVTKEEWLQWLNDFKEAVKLCTSFTMQLGDYEVQYFNKNKVNFGCEDGIKGASLAQIETITNKLKKL